MKKEQEQPELPSFGRKAGFVLLFAGLVVLNRLFSLNLTQADLTLLAAVLGVAYPVMNVVQKRVTK